MVAETMATPRSFSNSTITNVENASASKSEIDIDIYTYKIPQEVRNNVCNRLHLSNQWEEAATKMGYGKEHIAVSLVFFKKKFIIFCRKIFSFDIHKIILLKVILIQKIMFQLVENECNGWK